ncbi:MAG: hypothetical protein V2J07_07605 [Anaerolineae bacterium]|jgi:hypothetical protein|nr:hypothetical protein [Anaerolineae bacterium]
METNFVNRLSGLSTFVTEASGKDEQGVFQAFTQNVLEPNMDYYSCVIGISEEGLMQYANSILHHVAEFESLGKIVKKNFLHDLEKFQEHFPELDVNFSVILLPSLGLFHGMAVPFDGQVVLLLGVDALANLDSQQFHSYIIHELFHTYHFQQSSSACDAAERAIRSQHLPALWSLFFSEGMANCAVRIVYPQILAEDILGWRPLVEAVQPILSQLADQAKSGLRSENLQDISGFFYFPRPDEQIPTGCGYYLGFLLMEELRRTYHLDELIHLSEDELVPAMEAVLIEWVQ